MRQNTRKRLMAVVAFVCAGSIAQAGVVTTTTPFTGTTVTTDLMTVGNQSVPWTDSNGRTVSGTEISIASGFGLRMNASATGASVVFSNLGADITGLGFTWAKSSFPLSLSSVVFSNGDAWSGPLTPPTSLSFFGFLTDTPFTSATLTFSGYSLRISDFTTLSTPPGVPEPTTLVSSALGALGLSVLALRRRRRAALATA